MSLPLALWWPSRVLAQLQDWRRLHRRALWLSRATQVFFLLRLVQCNNCLKLVAPQAKFLFWGWLV